MDNKTGFTVHENGPIKYNAIKSSEPNNQETERTTYERNKRLGETSEYMEERRQKAKNLLKKLAIATGALVAAGILIAVGANMESDHAEMTPERWNNYNTATMSGYTIDNLDYDGGLVSATKNNIHINAFDADHNGNPETITGSTKDQSVTLHPDNKVPLTGAINQIEKELGQ